MTEYLERLKKFQANDKLIHSSRTVSKIIDRVEVLEKTLWEKYRADAIQNGATINDAIDWANKRMADI